MSDTSTVYYQQTLYQPPSWMSKYDNLTHCKHCNAVYNKNTKFVKVRDISCGTESFQYEYLRDCKPNVCPNCER